MHTQAPALLGEATLTYRDRHSGRYFRSGQVVMSPGACQKVPPISLVSFLSTCCVSSLVLETAQDRQVPWNHGGFPLWAQGYRNRAPSSERIPGELAGKTLQLEWGQMDYSFFLRKLLQTLCPFPTPLSVCSLGTQQLEGHVLIDIRDLLPYLCSLHSQQP